MKPKVIILIITNIVVPIAVAKANGYKEWKYLFIPSKQIMPNSSFMQLAKRFQE